MESKPRSADDPRFFLGIMPARQWADLEKAAHYALAEDERMAAIYRRSAGYSQHDMDRDPR